MNANIRTALRNTVYPVIVALSLGAAFAAHAAGEITPDDTATQAWSHTKTRAEVRAELLAARVDGSANVYSYDYNPLALAKSTLTRQEVIAATRVDREMFNYGAAYYGEDSGSFVLGQQWTTRPAASQTVAKVGK